MGLAGVVCIDVHELKAGWLVVIDVTRFDDGAACFDKVDHIYYSVYVGHSAPEN